MPDGLEHAPDLAVPALVEGELEPRGTEAPHAGGRRRAVLELHARRERANRLVVRLALDVRDVDLLDEVPRMREPMCQVTVVREEQYPGRIAVEPSDGNDTDVAADEIHDRRPPLRISRRGDRPPRLVQQDVAKRLLRDLTAVDTHDARRADERAELAGGAVDGDAPGLDQLVGAASRRDAGPGEVGVQAHPGIVGATLPRVRDYADLTRRLADLVVGYGANVQPGQIVGVTTYPGKEDMTREVARASYERGARWVDVVAFDPWIKRQRLVHADESTLDYIPPWLIDRLEWLSDEHAARITLNGPASPDALTGVDPARAGRDILPYLPSVGDVVNRRTTNWCVAPAPTVGWATLVYPGLGPDEAYERLWDAVAHICRLDEDDPVAAWRLRATTLESVAARLTERRFDAIRLHGPGTDLTVGLFPSSVWHAADFTTVDGLRHFPNIPSEEMFTTPDPARVDGHVTATRPLELYGAVIDEIRVEFSQGKAVRLDAGRGADTLRSVAAKDEGASRLGELALVDGEGRIGPLETIFYETLLDENAASHIALGNGYDLGVERSEDEARVNQSSIHVDFMIGSPELDVDGVTGDGNVVPLLRRGAWQV